MVNNLNIGKKKKFIKNVLDLTFFLISISGIMSLFIVFSRMPYVNNFFFKLDLNVFKKCLVFHVDFSLYFWMSLYIFIINIFLIFKFIKFFSFFYYFLFFLSLSSLFVFITIFNESEIFLINYIPLIKNYFFFIFFILFFIFLLLFYFFLLIKIRSYKKNEDKFFNIKNLSSFFLCLFYLINYLLIILNLFFSYYKLKNFAIFIDNFNYYELLIWSTGHLFQYINVFTLLIIFYFYIEKTFFISLNNKIIHKIILYCFIVNLCSYLLFFLRIIKIDYYLLNTYLMKYNSFFYFIVIFFLFLNSVYFSNFFKFGKTTSYFRFYSFVIFFMYFFGCSLGFLINKQNTIIPAHYHCSIGSVSLSFFIFSNILFNDIFYYNNLKCLFYKFFPFLFFLGQFFFSVGFLIAGFNGSLRKSFLNNQIINNNFEKFGLLIMAFGGFVAIFSGFYFVFHYLKIKKNIQNDFKWM